MPNQHVHKSICPSSFASPARVITACAAWLCYPSANVLISESVHPSVRGYLGKVSKTNFHQSSLLSAYLLPPGVFSSIFLALGMFESYLLGFLFHWRTMCFILSSQVKIVMMLEMVILSLRMDIRHKFCYPASCDGTCLVLRQRISVLARLQR